MPHVSPEIPEPKGPQSIVRLELGGYAILQQLDTVLECEPCGRETLHQILYLGKRIAEVRCNECGRCMGMDRDDVIRAFVGEIVMQVLRFPHDVTRELKQGFSQAMVTLPRQMAKMPFTLAQDAVRLLRLAWTAEENREVLEAIFNQVDTTLYCSACQKETPHRILYLGHRLAEARCGACNRAIGMTREEVFSDFVGEAVLHLLRLPQQVRRELRTDLSRAVQTLPRQMLRLPFRFARDFVRLVRVLRAPGHPSRGAPPP